MISIGETLLWFIPIVSACVMLRLIHVLKDRKYVNKKKIVTCKLMAIFGSGMKLTVLLENICRNF